MAIYGQKSINGRVEWLSFLAPFCDTGVAWNENILVPSPRWGDRVTYVTWALGIQSGVLITADVPWRNVVPSRPDYLRKCVRNYTPRTLRSPSGEPSGAGSKCLIRPSHWR